MIEELKKEILSNIKIINELKNSIKRYYNKEIEIFDIDEQKVKLIEDENELKQIHGRQVEDIGRLNVIMEIEGQNATFEYQKKIEELKKKEKDMIFSEFYRTGIISVKGIDVSVDKFYIKEVINEGEEILNFICTDKRVDKKIFGTIEDRQFKVKKIYLFKKSKIFYEIYLDKELFSNNKIVLDNNEKLNKFKEYIKKWTKEEHNKYLSPIFSTPSHS